MTEKNPELLEKIRTTLGFNEEGIRLISDSLSEMYIHHMEHTEEQNLNENLKDGYRNCYQQLKFFLTFMEKNMKAQS